MEGDYDPKRLKEEDAASTKIAELQRDLQDERDRYDLLQSQSDFAKLAATQEIERYRRECLCLKETVARLNDDYTTVRERGLSDRETINGLMEEMEGKEREFAAKYVELKTEIRDLECGRKRARLEVEEWKAKCSLLEAQLSKLKFAVLEENCLLKGKGNANGKLNIAEEKFHLEEEESFVKSSQKHAGEVDEELPERAKTGSPEQSRKNLLLVVVDSDSDDEAGDRINAGIGSRLNKKRLRDDGSLSSDTPSRECSVNGANITSVDATDVQTQLHSEKDLEVSNKGAQAYHKRNFNSQTSERAYVGRIPSSLQRKQAEKRAEELRSKLRPCNPSFVKPMGQSHVAGSFWLNLPTKFCTEELPTGELKMILEDENGVESGVKYIAGLKPALSAGWRRFALDHNLELGDAVIFELREPTRFKVYIIKAIAEESCEDPGNKAANEQSHGTDSCGNLDSADDQDVDLCNVW